MSNQLQKASFWKRISAYMFDTVLLVILTLALALVTYQIFKVDEHLQRVEEHKTRIAREVGHKFILSDKQFSALEEDEKGYYISRSAYDELMQDENRKAEQEVYNEGAKAYDAACAKDKQLSSATVDSITSLLGSYTVSLFLAVLILYFILPILFKHGRTLGKKMFGLAVVRSNSVKISTPVLFVRSMIGLYGIETMFPLFLVILIFILQMLGLVGIITLFLFLGLQIFVMIYTPTNSCIHDLLTDTVVVEMSSQRIYESEEALLEAKKAKAAEEAASAAYATYPTTATEETQSAEK